MKKIVGLLMILMVMTSCVVRQNNPHKTNENTRSKTSSIVRKIIRTADKFKGTPYKYGGNSKKGVDCSGLIHQVFLQNNISFPRVSKIQAKEGKRVSKRNAKKGDLVFFATSGRRRVSHVGLVHHKRNNEIFFIHSSSSKGVIISSLKNKYWSKAFLFVKRVL